VIKDPIISIRFAALSGTLCNAH